MAPPKFADLGKKAKDLFKKQYDYKNEVKVFSKSSGVKIETTTGSAKSGLTGNVKANWKDATFGDIEIEGNSGGSTKGQFKLSKVVDGLDVTTSTTLDDVTVDSIYQSKNVTATAKGTYSLSKSTTKVSSSLTFAMDGVALGCGMDFKGSAVSDCNLGAQYSTKDLVAALVTSKSGADLTASYFQSVSKQLTLGSSMVFGNDFSKRDFTLGGEYKLDKVTTMKAKAASSGVVDLAITHVLAEPKLKLNVAAQFDSKAEKVAAQKFGVSVSFGDF